MSSEISSVFLQLECLIQIGSSRLVWVNVAPGFWIIEVKVLDKQKKASVATLLEQSHQT